MADRAQCSNCGKFYPDFVERTDLYQNRQGHLTDGGIAGWGRFLGCGFALAVFAAIFFAIDLFFLDPIPHWLIDTGFIGGGVIIVLAFLRIIVLVFRPTVAYRYHCKSCGQDWQVEKPPASKAVS